MLRSKTDPLDVDLSAVKENLSYSQSPVRSGKWEINVKKLSKNRNDFFVIHHQQQRTMSIENNSNSFEQNVT